MKMAYGKSNLSSVELGLVFLKSSFLQEMLIEFSSREELNNKVKSKIVLEHILHSCQKWMVSCE